MKLVCRGIKWRLISKVNFNAKAQRLEIKRLLKLRRKGASLSKSKLEMGDLKSDEVHKEINECEYDD